MSAGLIPIVSRECGYGEDEMIVLPDCRIDTIRRCLLKYMNMDMNWIKYASYRMRQLVVEKYSRQKYVDSVRKALSEMMRMDRK